MANDLYGNEFDMLTKPERAAMRTAWFAYKEKMKKYQPMTTLRLLDFVNGFKAAVAFSKQPNQP